MAWLLRNVRVFDGLGFGDLRDVAVAGGLIASTGPDDASERVDGAGGYLLPGFIDCHVHLSGADTLDALASYGVTTALDMGSPAALAESLRGRTGVTDIRSSHLGATSPASAHAQRMRLPEDALLAGAEQAAAWVGRRTAEGVDYLKVIVDLPGFDQPTVDAIVRAAHARHRKVIAHASRLDAVQMAQRAGVDVLTHVPLDQRVDEGRAQALADAGAVVVPTLTMMKAIVDRVTTSGRPGPSYETARASVTALSAAGVPVLAGTDANDRPGAPASPPFGASLHDELALLVEAGLSATDAINAAGSVAARHFQLSDRGRIAPGLRADLVLLAENPLEDISATRTINGVWCNGVRV